MSKFFAACGLIVLATHAAAQEPAETLDPAIPEAFLFKAGSWDVNVIGGAYEEAFRGNDEVLAYGGVDLEYFAWDRFAFFGELLGYSIDQREPDAAAFGLNLGARWYFWKPCDWAAFYTEGGLGIIEADHRLPTPDGTHHNYVEQIGFGAKVRITDHVAIIGGIRYQHLSNANVYGEDRNPSIDAMGGYGGLSIAF